MYKCDDTDFDMTRVLNTKTQSLNMKTMCVKSRGEQLNEHKVKSDNHARLDTKTSDKAKSEFSCT